MSGRSVEVGTIRQHCKTLRMPTVASQFQKLAEQAWCDKQSHVRYLDVLLSAEVEERELRAVQRRLKEAQLPRTKTVDEFDWRCCTARSKSLTSLCRLQSHPAQYVSGIPSAAILLSISHPIRCSTRCLANVRARISGPMIAL